MLASMLRVLSILTLCLVGLGVNAHEGRPVYIEVSESPAQSNDQYAIQVHWKVPPVLSAESYPLIRLESEQCKSSTPVVTPRLEGSIRYLCPLDPAANSPLAISIRYPVDNPAISTLLSYTRLDGGVHSSFNRPALQLIELPLDKPASTISWQYLSQGVGHILSGYDHLLLVFCLMMIAGNTRRIVIAVSGFTVAHSITLGLASQGMVALRVDLIEILIALSIVFLAAEVSAGIKLGRTSTLSWRYPLATSTGFGLLHGFGFASALAELGLPHNLEVTALVFFNLGVELGQLLFIVVVLSIWRLLRRWKFLKPRVASTGVPLSLEFRPPTIVLYGCGILASYWFVERLFAFGAS